MSNIIEILGRATPAGGWNKNTFGFEIKDASGKIVHDIGMTFNKYSKVWKIESL